MKLSVKQGLSQVQSKMAFSDTTRNERHRKSS
jgi:hypothetical protein